MKHTGTVELETKDLLLRRFRVSDAQAMFDHWASDPEVTKFLTWPTHTDPKGTEKLLQSWVAAYDDPTCYQWAIVCKGGEDKPIGCISVVEHHDAVGRAHIGYCIGRPWWHQGYTSQALRAVIGFLFTTVGFQRIDARHDARNPHSGMVMAHCGMTREGVLRRFDINNQGVCDCVWYSILREEYQP